MSQPPLVIVSNRGPVSLRSGPGGDVEAIRGAGGLVTALRPLVDRHDVTWVASAMTDVERDIAASSRDGDALPAELPFRLRLVAHDPEAYRLFYGVVANPVLWFVQHRLWDLKQDPDADLETPWRDGYTRANRALADAAIEELDRLPGAALFVQDYHLYLLPSLVRAARPAARIAHFVHIPWVGVDDWRVLPAHIARDIHEGLLACDSVGFHTERWRAAFVDSCDALLGRGEEAERRSHANPIAVDVQEFASVADRPDVQERLETLRRERPELLVLRVDRVDPSKNAVRGFEAFGRLLEREAGLHGRIELLALLDPSREEIPEYVDYRAAVERAAELVNDRFAEGGWRPIRLEVRDDFPSSVAAYRDYDVLLVNPVMDGLNLVAKEGPLLNERDGVVVLSREAGAFEELGAWVIGVDPRDVDDQADALGRALGLDAGDRRARLEALRSSVRAHDLEAWTARELAELDARVTVGR